MEDAYAHVESVGDVLAGLDATSERAELGVKELIQELGIFAHSNMLLYVHGRLAEKVGESDLHTVGPEEWEKSTGVRGQEPWPYYVSGGTGLYRKRYPDYITARHDRGAASVVNTQKARLRRNGFLRFIGRDGAVHYRKRVKGQEPNPFVKKAYEATKVYANARVGRLGNTILG